MPQWRSIESSNLNRVLYFKNTALLAVEFKSGRIWLYGSVPWSVYMGLMLAKPPRKSHGKYFNRKIRLKYQYKEVPEWHASVLKWIS